MAQVPTLDNFTVSPSTGGGSLVSAPQPRNAGPEQLAQAGEAIQRAGTVAGDIFTDMQKQANQVRVDDAVNRAKERMFQLTYDEHEGYTNIKGINALERPNGQNLSQEYGGKLQTAFDDISTGLGNDQQRRAFSIAAQGMHAEFDGNIMHHESNEFRDYSLSVRDGTIANAQNDIAVNFRSPEKIGRDIDMIHAAVFEQARLLGKSATWAEAQMRDMTSSAHRTALTAALQTNDIGFVEDYLKLHSNEMNAQDAIAINGVVDKQKGMTYATNVAQNIIAGTSTGGATAQNVQMPVAGRVTSAYGHRTQFRTANGATSSAEHDGIDIASPEGSPIKADADGVVIFSGMKGGYGNYTEVQHADGSVSFYGHQSKQNVKKGDHVSQGEVIGEVGQTGNATGPHLHWGMRDPSGKSIDPRSIRTVGGGRGVGQNASLADQEQAVRGDPRLQGHPEWQEEAIRQVREHYTATREDQNQADEAATGAMEREVYTNGGTVTPQMLARLPDKSVARIIEFGAAVKSAARRDDNQGDPVLWAGLKSQIAAGAINSPQQLLQYAPKLSKNDFRDLTNDIIAIRSGDQKKIDSYGTLSRTMQFIHSEMLQAGIDWTPDAKDPKAAARFGQFQTQLFRQLGAMEQIQGKPLLPEEARRVALQLLSEAPNTAPHFWSDNQRGYELQNPQFPISAIPLGVQKAAEGYLRSHNMQVTPANIARLLAQPDRDFSQ